MRFVNFRGIVIAVLAFAGMSTPGLAQYVDIDVEGIEVTQGIQNLNNDEVLIDFRATTVRVYARILSASLRVSNVQARLRVLDQGFELLNMLSDNGPITVPLFVDREREDHTLNFTFTPELNLTGTQAQTLDFEVTLDPFDAIDETDEANNVFRASHDFECRRGPSIEYLPVDFQSSGAPDADLIEPGVGDAMVWAIYPWPQGPSSSHGRYRASGLDTLIYDEDIGTPEQNTTFLTELNRQRVGLSPTPDHLYGWVRDNPCSCNGAGWNGGYEAFGNTDPARHQRTFAHEIGHNLGFNHVSNLTNEVGWDVDDSLTLGPVKPDDLFDIMVPARMTDEAWIDPARYRGIYEDQLWQCTVFPPYELLELFHIAIFNENGPWNLGSVMFMVSERPPIEQQLVGSGQILIISESTGHLLYLQRFEPSPDTGDDPNSAILGASVITPYFADAGEIQLRVDGQIEAIRTRSPNPPTVQITSPSQGEAIRDGQSIVWTMDDADGDALQAFVRYSPDGEQRWVPLGALGDVPRLNLQANRLPASSSATIEVRVTDGFNTTVARVGQLRLGPDRAPDATILSPQDGQYFPTGANIVFLAQTDDPEDGALEETQVDWFSSIEGQFGQGHVFQLSQLGEGSHELELRVEDSGGNQVVERATIHIGIPPGGPNPGEASDSGNPAGQMLVTGYDDATGTVSIAYAPSCSASDHAIHYGNLSQVDSYGFTGTDCSIGTSGSAAFVPSGSTIYFLIVGDNGAVEGSYGRDSLGNERPESLDGACPLPQQLGGTCG